MTNDPTAAPTNTPKPAGSSAPKSSSAPTRQPIRKVVAQPVEAAKEMKDMFREVAETIVFVVVLVLMLKMFAAEAFVIPTGSMAITLLGDQKNVHCPECGYSYLTNSHSELEGTNGGSTETVKGSRCENCGYIIQDFTREHAQNRLDAAPSTNSGDRVLVAKYMYDGVVGSNSGLVKQVMILLALLISGAGGALLGGLLVQQIAQRFLAENRGPILGGRLVGGLIAVAVLGYWVFSPGPAWAESSPQRHDVVVFKFPDGPVKKFTPMNYIKRLIGLPGEHIAISHGKLFRLSPEKLQALPTDKRPEYTLPGYRENDSDLNLWKDSNMHRNDPKARALFEEGAFEIIRRRPEVMLAMRRMVYDNEHQAKSFRQDPAAQRWQPTDAKGLWKVEGETGFKHTPSPENKLTWLRYAHLFPREQLNEATILSGNVRWTKRLIDDHMSYNDWRTANGWHNNRSSNEFWVGDLYLECEVKVGDDANDQSEFVLELSKGPERYRARFQLATGQCTLLRAESKPRGEEVVTEIDSKPTDLKKGGTYFVRFANVDDRLTVWVNNKLPFKEGVEYKPIHRRPTENDLEPASLASQGATVQVRKLTIWRDTFYKKDHRNEAGDDLHVDDIASLEKKSFGNCIYYVQPGHYFCLGDNSQSSSDSRQWGMAPDRLMLGRAMLVYYPLNRMGRIR